MKGASLREVALSAGRWTGAATALRTVIQVGQTAVLARLLAPADFGLMAMSGTVVALAALFSELGLSSALIHFPLPSKQVRSALYVLNIGVGLTLAALVAAVAYPVASLYGHPSLLPVLILLALVFPLNAAGQQFRALAEKELRFDTLAKIEVASSLLGFAVAIMAAIAGAGVFALVAAVLASAACSSALAGCILGRGALQLSALDFAGTRPFLAYGGHRLGEQVWNTLQQQLDVIIASVFATPGAVAFYATPRTQSLRIANSIVNPIVTRIGLPVMARLQHDKAAIREVYLKTIRFTASINFPIYGLMALYPAEIVALLLGSQWNAAAPYLRIFAIWGMIRSTGNPSGSLLYAVGLVRRAHAWNLISLLVAAPVLWLTGYQWGLMGLAWTMLTMQVAAFFSAWRFLVYPACGAGFLEYANQLSRPLAATVVASGLSLLAAGQLPSAWALPFSVAAFGIIYVSVSAWVNRSWIQLMKELLSPLLRLLVE